jgi:tetratricopeptide (TPR) repeat protein
LQQYVEKKVEGNPFYLEELINSMVEDETLIESKAGWRLSRPLDRANVPATINGVISARIDRLDSVSRKVLQIASVIGRSFQHEILLQLMEPFDAAALDRALQGLEHAKLIYDRAGQSDHVYMFKHAMIQEVAYGRLLRKERQEIHQRSGAAIERLFPDRLSEHYETLAFHFKHAGDVSKTVKYMIRSGEKTLGRYAVEDSHRYFQQAYDLLSISPALAESKKSRLVDLLNRWSAAYYYRSDFRGLTERLEANRHLADALSDRSAQGAYYKWLGFAHWGGERYDKAYRHLNRSLEAGAAGSDARVMGEAHSWLTWTCAEMGRLDEAIEHGKRAQALSETLPGDHDIYFLATSGMGHAYWYMGNRKRSLEAGAALLRHGEKHANFRSFVEGYHIFGWSHFIAGDFKRAIECFREAVGNAAFPYYALFPKVGLGVSLLWDGRIEDAEQVLTELLHGSSGLGVEMLGAPAKALSGLVRIARGDLAEGIRTLEAVNSAWEKKKRLYPNATAEYVLGRVYLELALRRTPIPVSKVFYNAVFLTKTLPKARKKAERHFRRAFEIAGKIGAKGLMGQALLDLGLLYGLKKEPGQARDCIAEAITLFDTCGAECRLAQAKEAMHRFDAPGGFRSPGHSSSGVGDP